MPREVGEKIVDEAAASDAVAADLVKRLSSLGKMVVTAESCTAGLAAGLIARIPGASAVLWGSFVTYTLDAKMCMLGVDEETLKTCGAISRETACAMVQGALEKSGADYAVSVTGLAGPHGNGSLVSVGTVWIALVRSGADPRSSVFKFQGERNTIRQKAAETAIIELLKYIDMDENNK
jgi:PncC family amidohydrolase